MKVKLIIPLLCLGIVAFLACGPKDDPVQCSPDSIKNMDGVIYNG